MKTKTLIIILVTLIVVNLITIGAFIYVQVIKKGPPPPPKEAFEPFLMHPQNSKVRLTEDQQKKLMTLMDNFKNETMKLKAESDSTEHLLANLFLQSNVSKEKIDSVLKILRDIRYEISLKAADNVIKAKSFLNPQQQEIFLHNIMQPPPKPPMPPKVGNPPPVPPLEHGKPDFNRKK